jgi:hypothetical protein
VTSWQGPPHLAPRLPSSRSLEEASAEACAISGPGFGAKRPAVARSLRPEAADDVPRDWGTGAIRQNQFLGEVWVNERG